MNRPWKGSLDVDFEGFSPTLLEFLDELAANNKRPWFQENKRRYQREVLEPSLAFIREFRPRLRKLSRHFTADDRRMGGSLMRIYRDLRFAKDKSPYKTNVGIQFRHEFGRDVHAPGYYVHIAPGECFLGLGMWRPDGKSLGRVRQAIVDDPSRWRRAVGGKKFCESFQLGGERLKRPPRGFSSDHPLVEDLKRKDFVAISRLSERDVLGKGFLERVSRSFAAGGPLMRFLCRAIEAPF